jgi:hypothetical protein
VHLHLRHASAWRRRAAAARAARAHRGDGRTRGLGWFDAARVDRRAAGLGLRPNLGAASCDRRRRAARGLWTARRRRGHVGPDSDRRRGAGLRIAGHVVATGSDRHGGATRLVRRIAWLRGRSDVAVARRDHARRRSTTTTTIGTSRRTSARRPAWVGVRTTARSPVIRRVAVRVVAVIADATPVPTTAVIADAPTKGDPRIVVIPHADQRRRRSEVVHPRVPRGIPEHE